MRNEMQRMCVTQEAFYQGCAGFRHWSPTNRREEMNMIEKMNEHKASIDGAKILEFVNNHKTATFAEIHRHFNFGEDVSMKEIHAALYRASEDADLKQSQFVRDLIEVQRELISARRKVAALLRQL